MSGRRPLLERRRSRLGLRHGICSSWATPTRAVSEVAVVGKPDPERTEIVKAFVVLRPGFNPSDALRTEIQQHVRARLALHAYPREIQFINELPKTPSGKVQRFLLRRAQ